MDGRAFSQDQGGCADRRWRRLRLPRGYETSGPHLDAARGIGMVIPPADRTAPVCPPLPVGQLAFPWSPTAASDGIKGVLARSLRGRHLMTYGSFCQGGDQPNQLRGAPN